MTFLHHWISVTGFRFSLHDTNFLYTDGRMSSNPDVNRNLPLQCVIVLYVDDLLVLAHHEVTLWVIGMLERRFGSVKQNLATVAVSKSLLTHNSLYLVWSCPRMPHTASLPATSGTLL